MVGVVPSLLSRWFPDLAIDQMASRHSFAIPARATMRSSALVRDAGEYLATPSCHCPQSKDGYCPVKLIRSPKNERASSISTTSPISFVGRCVWQWKKTRCPDLFEAKHAIGLLTPVLKDLTTAKEISSTKDLHVRHFEHWC